MSDSTTATTTPADVDDLEASRALHLPEDVLRVLDPYAAADEPDTAEAAEPAATTVLLFDPASPAKPVKELAANFDPAQHIRWDHRPAVAALAPKSITGADGKPLLTAEQVMALEDHLGGLNLKLLLSADVEDLAIVLGDESTPDALREWALGRRAAQWTLAEIAADDPKG